MSATLKGTAGLVFGVDIVSAVIMQDYTSDVTGKITEAVDEDDGVVGYALSHSNRADVSGNYLFKGADIATIGATITLANAVGSGGIYVYSYGRKQSKDGFTMGNFKAIRVDGIS